ncbi:MAG: hypothetical protein KAS04_02065 [Candidatus Aenigmarchaeota archaeon]|nr:hypothetical protein [Candidatus Aenigmarchaeota archaeon]
MAEVERPLQKMEKAREKSKEEKEKAKYRKELKKWEKVLKDYDTVVDYFLWKARDGKGIWGDVVVSPALLDQIVTLNPVCLEGQAEIIYNVFVYRCAKWHYSMEKADEYFTLSPTAPPAFAGVMNQRERYEGQVKSGLASAAQAVADYELLKHDERKYREILDYFEMGKKDEHILRALFIDRVDAYTGEGYSMISMAKRWPTIIADFLNMKSEWRDKKVIREGLKVTDVEASVLKTKNELFIEWKKLFFPDVRERYGRIKNLLESRRRSIDEYREWLKPYVNRLKLIKQHAEFKTAASNLTDITKSIQSPDGEVFTKIWFWKRISPEEVGKPMVIQGWGEIPLFDDWVKEHIILLEAKYDLIISEEEISALADAWSGGKGEWSEGRKGEGTGLYHKRLGERVAMYPTVQIDNRFLYYFFIDLDYVCDYKKGSSGPMVLEDQYWHFHPFLVSKNFVLLILLELEFKRRKFSKEITKLIGVKEHEEEYMKEARKMWPGDDVDEEEKIKLGDKWRKSWNDSKNNWIKRRSKLKKSLRPVLKYFIKLGPYEINAVQRISKTYALYFGAEIAELRNLIKETSYKISGQRP